VPQIIHGRQNDILMTERYTDDYTIHGRLHDRRDKWKP